MAEALAIYDVLNEINSRAFFEIEIFGSVCVFSEMPFGFCYYFLIFGFFCGEVIRVVLLYLGSHIVFGWGMIYCRVINWEPLFFSPVKIYRSSWVMFVLVLEKFSLYKHACCRSYLLLTECARYDWLTISTEIVE